MGATKGGVSAPLFITVVVWLLRDARVQVPYPALKGWFMRSMIRAWE